MEFYLKKECPVLVCMHLIYVLGVDLKIVVTLLCIIIFGQVKKCLGLSEQLVVPTPPTPWTTTCLLIVLGLLTSKEAHFLLILHPNPPGTHMFAYTARYLCK